LYGGTLSFGSSTVPYTHVSDSLLLTLSPSLPAGALYDVKWQAPSGNALLYQGWLADFADVPQADTFHDYIESVFRAGIAAGCGGGNYCPVDSVTRAQMAVFLIKAKHGSSYVPPHCSGVFPDVPCPGQFTDWVERLAVEGVTAGCGGGNYCPDDIVTRRQMSVFLLKTHDGSSYQPPNCVGVFGDVPCTPGIGYADWIEELYSRGVTGGCQLSPLLYCPASPNNRGQMAVFLTKTFGLAFSGPWFDPYTLPPSGVGQPRAN
jgi:hypothetical protein